MLYLAFAIISASGFTPAQSTIPTGSSYRPSTMTTLRYIYGISVKLRIFIIKYIIYFHLLLLCTSCVKKINGDSMEQIYTNVPKDAEDVIVAMNYCVNTNRTYIYEIKNGEIINERRVQGEI